MIPVPSDSFDFPWVSQLLASVFNKFCSGGFLFILWPFVSSVCNPGFWSSAAAPELNLFSLPPRKFSLPFPPFDPPQWVLMGLMGRKTPAGVPQRAG